MARSPEGNAKTGSDALARVVRERREELGLTRQELSDATGIPYPTIAQIETAYRGVSPARLGVIARVLQLDPKELYHLLASTDEDTSAAPPAARASGRRTSGSLREGSWHSNPRFAAAVPAASPAPTAAAGAPEGDRRLAADVAGPGSDEVVDAVLELLRTLPAERRIEALGQVQNRLLAQLVEHRLDESL